MKQNGPHLFTEDLNLYLANRIAAAETKARNSVPDLEELRRLEHKQRPFNKEVTIDQLVKEYRHNPIALSEADKKALPQPNRNIYIEAEGRSFEHPVVRFQIPIRGDGRLFEFKPAGLGRSILGGHTHDLVFFDITLLPNQNAKDALPRINEWLTHVKATVSLINKAIEAYNSQVTRKIESTVEEVWKEREKHSNDIDDLNNLL